ncbi:STAS domain-containing protein [Pseudonocardia spirodelae]|uniref:STAS domain-containing protein n=1 Tax=Pseudonocardia spirodelae TaxID=3133431 RepID=A0ABU8TAR1_9PSEU
MTTLLPPTPGAVPGDPARDGPDAPARLHVDHPLPGVHVIAPTGILDRAAGARLLRLADLEMTAPAGGPVPRHLVLDLAGVTAFGPGGAAVLRHLRYAAHRRRVRCHLAGPPPRPRSGPPPSLDGVGRFTDLADAVAALAELAAEPYPPPS